jgi:hypothetical protein
MFQTKVVERIKTHILCLMMFFSENRAVCEIAWKNMVEPDGLVLLTLVSYSLMKNTNWDPSESRSAILAEDHLDQSCESQGGEEHSTYNKKKVLLDWSHLS